MIKDNPISAIARNTFRESRRQPVYYLLTIFAAVLILLSVMITFFNFMDEDKVRMIKDMGLATITVCGLFLSVFSASSVLYDEIENKTALTILCKPISREGLLLGKFLGICLAIGLSTFILYTSLGLSLYLEMGVRTHNWKHIGACFDLPLLEGVFLAFLQIVLISSISVVLSTRLPIVINITICFIIFILGHLSDHILFSLYPKDTFGEPMAGEINAMGFFGRFAESPFIGIGSIIHIIIPNLENYNVAVPVSMDTFIPLKYLLSVSVYTFIYVSIVLLFGIIIFRKREVL